MTKDGIDKKSFFSQTVSVLMKESGFEREICEEILTVFCNQADKHLADIKDFMMVNNFQQIAKTLHTFKGGAGTARVKEMAEYAIEAEEAAINNDMVSLEKSLEILDELLGVLKAGKKY